jgi:hypothetical protein
MPPKSTLHGIFITSFNLFSLSPRLICQGVSGRWLCSINVIYQNTNAPLSWSHCLDCIVCLHYFSKVILRANKRSPCLLQTHLYMPPTLRLLNPCTLKPVYCWVRIASVELIPNGRPIIPSNASFTLNEKTPTAKSILLFRWGAFN